MLTPTPSYTPAQRFTDLIGYLRLTIGELGNRRRLYGPLLILIWVRLNRMARRFASIEARLRAGTLVASPPRARTAAPRDRPPTPPPHWLPAGMAIPVLSRKFGCLKHLVPEAHISAGQLCYLLQQPDMRALFAEAPQIGRILRP